MKYLFSRRFLPLIILSFLSIPGFGQDFVRSRPPACRCQFEMPGIPTSSSQLITTDVGPITYYSYVLEGSQTGESFSCVVSYADYPEEAVALDSTDFLEEFLTTSISQAVEQLNGVLIYSTEIMEREYEGRLYRIDYGDGLSVKSKVFLAGRRFYLIQAFYQKDKEIGHRVDRFVDSFQILPQP